MSGLLVLSSCLAKRACGAFKRLALRAEMRSRIQEARSGTSGDTLRLGGFARRNAPAHSRGPWPSRCAQRCVRRRSAACEGEARRAAGAFKSRPQASASLRFVSTSMLSHLRPRLRRLGLSLRLGLDVGPHGVSPWPSAGLTASRPKPSAWPRRPVLLPRLGYACGWPRRSLKVLRTLLGKLLLDETPLRGGGP